MTPSISLSIVLFLSAYSPLFLLIIVKDFDFKLFSFENSSIVICLAIIILGSLIGLYSTILTLEKGKKYVENHIRTKNVKNVSNEFFNYAFPYLLTLYGNNLKDFGDVLSLALFLLLLMFLTISSKMVFINPILSYFKYSLYEIEGTQNEKGISFTIYTLTKESLHLNEVYPFVPLSKYLIFIPNRMK